MGWNLTCQPNRKTDNAVLRSAWNGKFGAPRNGGRSMSGLTLSQAAKALGKSKSTLNRAIKTGRMTAVRNDDGTFSIDPSELYRAFPEPSQNAHQASPTERPRTPISNDLHSRISMLEQLLEKERDTVAREREIAADLKEDRDRWRQQATSLLSDQRKELELQAKRLSWWPWRRNGREK